MVISIFKPPEDGKTWAEQKVGDICDCTSYEYEKYFNGAGTFTAEVPVNTRFRSELLVNRFLVTDSGDALIIKNIQTTLEKIKLTGYDLNGLLCDRVILGTDEDGRDPHDGSTEECVKYYVRSNMVDSAVPERNLPRFDVTANSGRGTADDSAYPRYQNLQELVTELCGAAKLGWRVSINKNASLNEPIFLFDVAEQVDRSASQEERDRVIFSAQVHNVSTMTREVGITAAKNTFYLDIDGTVVQYPKNPEEGAQPEKLPGISYDRREEYCALSGDSLDEEVYKVEAEHNIADRWNETDSLTIEAGSPLDYGVRYDAGTVVTVYDRDRTIQLDSVISAVTVKRTGNEYSVKLTLGESKPKLLDQYQKRDKATMKVVRKEITVSGGNAYATFRVANQSAVKYDKIERGLLSVDFSVDSADSDVLFSGNQLCTASGAGTAEFIYKVDGAVQDFKPAQYLPAGKHVVPHIFPMNLTVGKHNFAVCMLSQDGTGLTAAGGLLGALSGIISGIREQTPPNDDLVLHFSGLPAGELTLAQNMIASSSAKKYVDWGDGSDIEESTANATVSHTYSAAGDYVVTIKTDALNFGRDSVSPGQNSFIGTAAAQYLTRIYFPDNAAIVNFYGANDLPNLETLVFGNSATAIRWNFGSSQNKVTSLLLPETAQRLGFSGLNRTGIISLIIPKSVSSWNSTSFPATLRDFRTYSATNIAATTATGLERLTIGGNATATGVYSSKKLVSVKFPAPNKVTSVGSFSGCSALSDIVLPASATSIASFENCSALPGINIPAGISEIKNNTFKGCSSLASVLGWSGLTAIGDYAFQGCAALSDITFPDGLTSIGISAFNGCSSTFSPGTPPGLASVGASAFMNSGITDFVFRSGCSVSKSAFLGSGLSDLTVEDGVTTIPENCFQNTKSLGSVAFPGSLTTIAASAFTGSGITDVSFGDSALSIGNYAFAETALSKVTIPSGVVSVGREAFRASALKQLSISDNPSVDTGAFRGCLSLTSASMGALKSIPALAFSGCSTLSSVQLGAGITIGSGAFTGCGFTALSLVSHLAESGGTTTYGGKYAIGAGAFQSCAQLEFVDGRAYKWNVGLKYTESSYDSDSRTWSSTTTDLGLQEGGRGIYDLLEATEDSVFKGTKLKELSAYPKPDNVITDTYKKVYSVYHYKET